jgi:hypothetical protein
LCITLTPIAFGIVPDPQRRRRRHRHRRRATTRHRLEFRACDLGIFTTRKQFVHKIAGRIVGLTRDVDNAMAYVMTLPRTRHPPRTRHQQYLYQSGLDWRSCCRLYVVDGASRITSSSEPDLPACALMHRPNKIGQVSGSSRCWRAEVFP